MAEFTCTPLAVSVLALLFERPMHPYEMYQLLIQRKEDRLLKIRPGSLYHTVDRLAKNELVESIGTDREGNRPERTTYRVTDKGREALKRRLIELLSAPIQEYPQFTLALSESHNLDADTVVRLLTERVALMQKDLDELSAIDAVARDRGIPRLFYVGLEYTTAVRTAEISWLRGLIEEIASGALPWDPTLGADTRTHHPGSPWGPLDSPNTDTTDTTDIGTEQTRTQS